ncbi:hypothetical protein [Novosphingobium sediminicola]|uniref:Uncharacterized protein n=1 Tax=Novosphingobium sediminicola TaxID=563162 RepID=A0A7W6CKG9_9SPHN|nr:hypothetical protein [Novosphingobium sediminicola]MBB3953092.1 hypothetical protein [Novosphingobium sediminicola]
MASNRSTDTAGQCNIIRLPTAARRKVKQVGTVENRKARMALHRIPKERFLYPPVREGSIFRRILSSDLTKVILRRDT